MFKLKVLIPAALVMLLALIAAVLIVKPRFNGSGYQKKTVFVADHQLETFIADSNEKRQLGLAVFDYIDEDQAMLFSFDSPALYQFWMKDMKFPIDIIWIRNKRVVDISSEVELEKGVESSEFKLYRPKYVADMVIEVNSGWTQRNNIEIGDEVEF